MKTTFTTNFIRATTLALLASGCQPVTLRDPGVDGSSSTQAGTSEGETTQDDTSSTGTTSTGAASGESTGGDGGTTGEECQDLRASVEQIFAENCSGCHANGQTKGGFGTVDDVDAMIAQNYIARGEPELSPVFERVASGEMPLGGPPLPDASVELLRSFITACTDPAPDDDLPGLSEAPACVGVNQRISNDAGLAAMKTDIGSLDLVTAPRIRYIDLSYLHNAGYCDEQIQGRRLALSKALNSVSRGDSLIPPHPINPEHTIFRIDLSHYKWTAALWGQIVAENPYAISYQSKDALFIRQLTGSDVFVQSGEWLIDAIVRPPLYHALLDIPATRQELEARFGIDIEANVAEEELFDVGEVVRAGVFSSGVSENNRSFECHKFPEAKDRYYCLSHDFASNQGAKSDIFSFPLDFVPDGGEVIFTLVNGLQGYMIVNKEGARIDVAPLEVVTDVEHGGEPVQNGISCMGCHTAGMRIREDEVWPAVDGNIIFNADLLQRVENLYSVPGVGNKPGEVGALLGQIQGRFLGALGELGVPERIAGEEPTAAVHLAFELDVTLSRAAAEFGVTESELIKQLAGLKGLDLLDKKPVDRQTFQLNFAVNACSMNLGITSACSVDPGP